MRKGTSERKIREDIQGVFRSVTGSTEIWKTLLRERWGGGNVLIMEAHWSQFNSGHRERFPAAGGTDLFQKLKANWEAWPAWPLTTSSPSISMQYPLQWYANAKNLQWCNDDWQNFPQNPHISPPFSNVLLKILPYFQYRLQVWWRNLRIKFPSLCYQSSALK